MDVKYDYGSLMVVMPDELQASIVTGIQSTIDPDDLLRLELEPHVTIRYGFDANVVGNDFIDILAGQSPIKLTLLEPDIFQNEEDVLILGIFSECLHKLNTAVGHLPLSGETYREYKPHLTVAYLRKGTGWKYVGDPRLRFLQNQDVVLDTVVYSPASGERTKLYLTGDPQRSTAGVSLHGLPFIDGRELKLAFCATGPGGGVDNSCSSREGSSGPSQSYGKSMSGWKVTATMPDGSVVEYGKSKGVTSAAFNGYYVKAGDKEWNFSLKSAGHPDEKLQKMHARLEKLGIKEPLGPNKQQESGIKVLKTNIGGTTGAKLVERDGQKYIAKQYHGNKEQVTNELAANRLYGLLATNAGAPKSELAMVEGKAALLAEHIPDAKELNTLKGAAREAANEKIRENFVADALLANWDVIGTGADNVLVGKDGSVYRVDNGGALEYRAQGEKKGSAFGKEVTEIDTLRNASINPDAAKVYSKLTEDQISSQVTDLVSRFDKEKVIDILEQSGYQPQRADKVAALLEARVGYLSQRFGEGKSAAEPGLKGQGSATDKRAELQARADAARAKAAEERSKNGSVSAATKRERAEANKALSEHKEPKAGLAFTKSSDYTKIPEVGVIQQTKMDIEWKSPKNEDYAEPATINSFRGGQDLPATMVEQLAKSDDPYYRFIYDADNDVFHLSDKNINLVDHGDFLDVTEKSGQMPDMVQVRGTYDASSHELLVYDVTKEAAEIASVAGISEKAAQHRIDKNLDRALKNVFTVNGKPPKLNIEDINSILGFSHGVPFMLAAPRDVREAGDSLDVDTGDIKDHLELPPGVKVNSVDNAIQDALDHVTSRGMGADAGTEYLISVLEERGIEPDEGYLRALVETHSAIAESASTRRRTLRDDDIWGYEYVKNTDRHDDLDGTIASKHDPFWQTYWPPNGYGCQCTVREISWDEAEDEGYVDMDNPDLSDLDDPSEGFDSDYQELYQDEDDIAMSFCPTGPGGGIDNSCGRGGDGASEKSGFTKTLEYVKSVPKEVVAKVRAKVTRTYNRLEARYGPKYAKAIIGVALAAQVSPIPGTSIVAAAPIIGLAEMHRLASKHHFLGLSYEEPDVDEAARELMEELESIDYELDELELGFCPTGPGGGIDNSCGRGDGMGRVAGKGDPVKSLTKQRDDVKARIAAVKAGKKDPKGATLSQLKKERAALNQKIDAIKLGGKKEVATDSYSKLEDELHKLYDKQGAVEDKLFDIEDRIDYIKEEMEDASPAKYEKLEAKLGPLKEKQKELNAQDKELEKQINKLDKQLDKIAPSKIPLDDVDDMLDARPEYTVIGDFDAKMGPKGYAGLINEGKSYVSELKKQDKIPEDEDNWGPDYCCRMAALENYQDDSSFINDALRNGGKLDKEEKEQAKWLDKAIAAAPALKEDIIVERGIMGCCSTFGKLNPGDVIRDKGFMSTTLGKKVADGFADGGAKFQIIVPAGTKGLYMPAVNQSFSDEKEFLLPRGGRLEVVAVKKSSDPDFEPHIFQVKWVGV